MTYYHDGDNDKEGCCGRCEKHLRCHDHYTCAQSSARMQISGEAGGVGFCEVDGDSTGTTTEMAER